MLVTGIHQQPHQKPSDVPGSGVVQGAQSEAAGDGARDEMVVWVQDIHKRDRDRDGEVGSPAKLLG